MIMPIHIDYHESIIIQYTKRSFPKCNTDAIKALEAFSSLETLQDIMHELLLSLDLSLYYLLHITNLIPKACFNSTPSIVLVYDVVDTKVKIDELLVVPFELLFLGYHLLRSDDDPILASLQYMTCGRNWSAIHQDFLELRY